ncbi:hypothetical protein HPC49_27335 [Pyxidicoccus fallax]|uniref:Lipoprotein n=1 Tax=Pyxidicoccus fallax TaxID=394095 RepID=A0A848LSI9_9BACT|nr:hypothetical protein [Pyxidicoccus fallax]NMO20905.1 hypothetical protein [Pyxidicoccus fallax]NPC81919.1 hypothetical protein [Pyxidicoccus fallax]
MDYQKLFQVLVMGGALMGGATGCDQGNRQSDTRSPQTEGTGGSGVADAGTAGGTPRDAGAPPPSGGGVKGW